MVGDGVVTIGLPSSPFALVMSSSADIDGDCDRDGALFVLFENVDVSLASSGGSLEMRVVAYACARVRVCVWVCNMCGFMWLSFCVRRAAL